MHRRRWHTALVAPEPADHLHEAHVTVVADEHPECDDRHFPAARAAKLKEAMGPVGDQMRRQEGRWVHLPSLL